MLPADVWHTLPRKRVTRVTFEVFLGNLRRKGLQVTLHGLHFPDLPPTILTRKDEWGTRHNV